MQGYPKDEEILQRLMVQEEAVTTHYFHHFRVGFISFILATFRCEEEKAAAIYPESYAILYFNIMNKKLVLPLRSSLKTYLYSVGKHVFQNRYYDKYQKKTVPLSDNIDIPVLGMVEQSLVEKERAVQLRSLLQSLDDPCQELLKLFYFKNNSFEAIATKLGENEGRLRKRKYDCLKKLHRLIANKKIALR